LYRQADAQAGQEVQHAYGVAFKLHTCNDASIGIDAFQMMMPAGWEFQGGVYWGTNNPSMPAVLACQVSNPAGFEALEVFPNQAFFWNTAPFGMPGFPVGSYYFGSEVRPPMPALQALQQLIIPRMRGKVQGLQLVSQQHLPHLAQQIQASSPHGQTGTTQSDGGKVRIRYHWNEAEIEEDIYGVIEMTRMGAPGMFMPMELISWTADYLFGFRALQGQLERLSDLFMTMIRSFRLNPRWLQQYSQMSNYMVQNQLQQINNIGQLSRSISQTNNQISDMIMDSWNKRQATYDRISTNFSQAIRGVDAYYDPNKGYGVELPGGYRHAWTNGLGEYVVSDDATFNPNIGSNLNWQEMARG
jgi:hypothetical protein